MRNCRELLGAAACLALVLGAAGCASDDSTGDPMGDPAGEAYGCAGYEGRGGFAAGVTTLEMDGVPVEVWYPVEVAEADGAERAVYDMREWLPPEEAAKIPDEETPLFEMEAFRDLPAAEGAFPVVLFSHGMGGYRMQSSFLMTHLASWGIVAVAPEHPERGLAVLVADGVPMGDDGPQAMRDALALMESENAAAGGRFEGRLDLSRVAATGHSAGGAAVLEVAGDDGVDTWMTFASGGFGSQGGPTIPSFMMGGTNDEIASIEQIESGYDRQVSTKRYLGVNGMGHLGFTDICAIGADRGGVLQIAVDNGVEVPELLMTLGQDGCADEDLAPEPGWEVVSHYTVAHLKRVFGLNADGVGLDDEAMSCFGDRVAAYKHDEG